MNSFAPFPDQTMNSQGTPEHEKKRGGFLTAWLILILIYNLLFALIYFLARDFMVFFLGIPPWSIYSLGALSLLIALSVVFLFKWKKWAFFLLCGSTLIAIIINLISNPGLMGLTGLLGPVILYLILRPKWHMFE